MAQGLREGARAFAEATLGLDDCLRRYGALIDGVAAGRVPAVEE